MRLVLIAVLLLVAACGTEKQDPPPTGSQSRAPTTSAVTDDEDINVGIGAVDTLLAHCTPGLAGARSCRWATIGGAVTELTGKIHAAVADDDGHADLTAALDDMDQATTAFAPCAGWFDSNAVTGDQITCDTTWYALTGAWTALKKALDWP